MITAVCIVIALLCCGVNAMISKEKINELFNSPIINAAPCDNTTNEKLLQESNDMPMILGDVFVQIPFNEFIAFFFKPIYWTSWNHLFNSTLTTELGLCDILNATYNNAPKAPFPKLIDHHYIVQYETDNETLGVVGWSYLLQDAETGDFLVFGRHTYAFEVYVSNYTNGTILTSFEKAYGPHVAKYSQAWTVALQQALIFGLSGAMCLENVYLASGGLMPNNVQDACADWSLPLITSPAHFNEILS